MSYAMKYSSKAQFHDKDSEKDKAQQIYSTKDAVRLRKAWKKVRKVLVC